MRFLSSNPYTPRFNDFYISETTKTTQSNEVNPSATCFVFQTSEALMNMLRGWKMFQKIFLHKASKQTRGGNKDLKLNMATYSVLDLNLFFFIFPRVLIQSNRSTCTPSLVRFDWNVFHAGEIQFWFIADVIMFIYR